MAESQDASLVCINSEVFFTMSKCFWIIINLPTVPYYWFYQAKYIAFFCFPVSTTVLPPFGVTVLTVPLCIQVTVLLTSKCLFLHQGWHCVPELWYTKVPSKDCLQEVLDPSLKRAH